MLRNHTILVPQLAKIVLIGDGITGYPDKGGKTLRDYNGKFEPIKKDESLRIAHSYDLFDRGDWDQSQHDCFLAERIQPFKQIFRELYVVTKQEKKDQTKSNRFVRQQVSPWQAMALWNARGRHTQEDVVKIFHDIALIAQVRFQHDYGTASEFEGLTVDAIEFRKRDEVRPMKLIDVPPKIFSEVMRDIDLVVSVAHRGEVELLDNKVRTTWGRIGSDGQSKITGFADAAKAQSEYNKLIKEKTVKGYKETQ